MGRSMHMVGLGWLPKYLAPPRLAMAHLHQYVPLLSIRANGAPTRGAPLLNLREGDQNQRGGQDSNGALSKYAPLATLVAYGALLRSAPLLSQGKGAGPVHIL